MKSNNKNHAFHPGRIVAALRNGVGGIAAAAVCTALITQSSASSTTAGFDNGFEDGLGGWTIEASAEPVAIVGTEGATDYEIYSELGIEVVPNLGQFMLRLGEPKTKNETQNRGRNTISQHFVAQASQLSIALRLFSLDHRGDDTLRIALTDADGADIASSTDFAFGNGTVCGAPCSEVIDAGKRKDEIATAWQELRFTTLEPGAAYTLTIELEAGQNESLASWLYLDGVNIPPEAVINVSPVGTATEGDFVVFDCLESVDPEGSDLRCIWEAEGFAGVSSAPIIGTTVVYYFPQDGSGTVQLEVTDGEESTTTSRTLAVRNQAPLVHALDVEVLPGGTVDLVCRSADPGALDTQTVSFSTEAGEISGFELDTENVPALSSGLARARLSVPATAAPGTFGGACSVSDGSASGSDDFTVRVIQPPSDGFPSVSTVSGAPLLRAGASYLGGLQEPDGVSVYELRLPNGDEFPAGAEVLVTAHVPVDYDIAVLNGSADPTVSAAPWVSAPFVSAPFVSAPFVSVPFVSAPFVSAPFVSAPFVSAPFVSAPFVSAPFVSAPFVSAPFVSAPFVSAPLTRSLWDPVVFAFENFPLSQLAGAPDGSNVSGVDVSINDLGAQNLGDLFDAAVFVKGLSAEFGTNREQVLAKVGPGEKGLFVAVIPQAGSFSTAPFSLEVEASVPLPQSEWLPACFPENNAPLVTASADVNLPSYGSETLIVTQADRIMATFGMTPADWNAWMEQLDPFLQMVGATVLSVPSSIYDEADINPCDVDRQNAVAAAIKAEIDAFRATRGNVKYVQLMGSLDIIPPLYLPDETQTGNEALFAADLLTKPGTPLGAAVGQGYMLTDAYYVDEEPQPFNGRSLYVEDISVSRLVETPDEILANAERFVATGGVINLMSVEAGTPGAGTQSTGYDFFIDGTDEINRILSTGAYAGYANRTLNNDVWDAEALRCQFFGAGDGCSKPVSAVNAVNAHMSYNAGLTAEGFNCQYLGQCSGDPLDPLGEVFLSSESASMYVDPDDTGPALAINGVTFSIGCHSALSVPDAWGLSELLGLPLNPAGDWVQELGSWVGSWNFAYGDTDVPDRGTEGIMPLVIENFGQGMTLGEALVRAKWQYGAGLFEFGVYDEKSLVGLSVFGMPQARLEGAGSGGGPTPSVGDENVSLAIDAQLQSNSKGVWWAVDGHAQSIVGRPLLPVVKPFELADPGTTSIHGVALRGGTYEVFLDQDPVFAVQTHDLVTSIGEPQPCVETLSPSLLASVTSFDSPEGLRQSFIVQPGQFRCTDTPETQEADNYVVNGDFRIWSGMELELQRPSSASIDDDRKPPVVTRQDLLGNPDTGIVAATLDAEDSNGIREIVALVYADDDGQPGGTGTATPYSVTERNGEGVFELLLPDAFDKLLSFQYIDGAGNITAKTLKGALLRAIEVYIRTTIVNLGGNTEIRIEIGDFESLVDPYLVIDFGDGSQPQFIELDDPGLYTIDADGTATVVIDKDYSGLNEPSVTIRVEVRAAGALGTDERTLFACSDPVDDVIGMPSANIVGCGISSEGTVVSIDMVLEGPLAPDVQYRLVLPQTNTQLKYADGEATGPKKVRPIVSAGGNKLQFMFDAGRIGWDGRSLFQFVLETQDGVAGGQGQGFVDETEVKEYVP